MDFELDDQQRALRDEARRFLAAEAPTTYARAMMDDERGYDPTVWQRMAGLGWTALPLPEEHGGLGMGFIALAILLGEMGRVVLPGPYLSSVALAGLTIADAGTPAQRARLLPAIAGGEATATLVVDGHVEARDGALHGTARWAIDGANADHVIVLAHNADGPPSLYLARPDARAEVVTLDRTRRVAELTFDGATAEPLGDHTVVHRAEARAAAALAAEMLGGAEHVLELSVDHAGSREQFGRPIGSFQAVKHRAADMKVEVESLRNAVYYAAWAIERDHADAELAASVAKATASDAAVHVAQSGIQIHGGIGFTWEHDMHLFYKRALVCERAFGDARAHRERVAQTLRERAGVT